MIRTAVVTGATGHLGNTLVRHLLEWGVATRVLLRPGNDAHALEGLDVERANGDITQPDSLVEAFRGAEVVFHVAGLVSLTTGQEDLVNRVNVEGTRNVIDACVAAKVKRLVYTGSVHALVEPSGGPLDETAGFNPPKAFGAYGHSKASASKLVQDAARQGRLDTVIVLPTGCIGPYDFRFSAMGRSIAAAARGTLLANPAGAFDWVDVRDVAQGTLAAAVRGRSGEAYLLNHQRASVADVMRMVASAAGVKPPRVTVPFPVLSALAALGPAFEHVTGRPALLTPYAVRTLRSNAHVSDAKARNELGYTSRSLETSLSEAWTWLRDDPRSPLNRKR